MSTPPNGPETPSGASGPSDAGDEAFTRQIPAHEGDQTPTAVVSGDYLPPARGSEQPTVVTPMSTDVRHTPAEPVPGTYWQGGESEEAPAVDPLPHHGTEPAVFPEGVFDEPPSRAGAHLWALLIALVLSPVAWFLLSDGSARLYWSLRADPESVNIAGVVGLGVGLLVAMIVLLTGRWSSVGVAVAGSIGFLGGLAFAAIPARTLELVARSEEFLDQFGGFGSNVYAYAVESGIRGHFLIAGFGLILVAAVSHGARRKGRREEFARLAVRAARGENPWG